MTLREHEQQRSQRAQRKNKKQRRRCKQRFQRPYRSSLAAMLSPLNDSQVLTFFEWCQINRFSERTGRRILASGTGPPVIPLSVKRIGIRVGDNRLWQQSRTKSVA